MTPVPGHAPQSLRSIYLLLALVMACSMVFYVQRVLIPYQVADAAAHNRPRGTLSDLYPRWVGARNLLLRHQDPYSAEVTREIQLGYYGKVLDPQSPEDPKDEQRFAYPVYVAFLLAPTVKLPFDAVRTGCTWLLLILSAASVSLWLKFLRWKLANVSLISLTLVVLSSYAAVQGIKLQQLSLLVGALLAICAALLAAEQLLLAGICLGIASIKPQLVALPAAWLCLWSVRRWRGRKNFALGFASTVAVLMIGGQLLLPGWMTEFVEGLRAYARYTQGVPTLNLLATPLGGTILNAMLMLATAVVCWRARDAEVSSQTFVATTALVLLATVLIVPMIAPYNQVLLIPAILLVLRAWKEFISDRGIGRLIFLLAAVVVLWPWLASFAILLASFVLPASSVQRAWAVPLWTSIAVPVVILPLQVVVLRKLMRSEFGVSAGDAANHSL